MVDIVGPREIVGLLARIGNGEGGERRIQRAVVQHRPAGGHVHAHNLQRVGIALDPRGELAGHVHLEPLHASRLGVLEPEAGHVDLRADAQHVARRRAAGKRQHRATQSRARHGSAGQPHKAAPREIRPAHPSHPVHPNRFARHVHRAPPHSILERNACTRSLESGPKR